MVWKDVLIGFTVAGIISAFVPNEFFTTLFSVQALLPRMDPVFWAILSQTLVGPVVAFFTFIGRTLGRTATLETTITVTAQLH